MNLKRKQSLKSYYLQAVAQVSSSGSYILLASEMSFYVHWRSSSGALNYSSASFVHVKTVTMSSGQHVLCKEMVVNVYFTLLHTNKTTKFHSICFIYCQANMVEHYSAQLKELVWHHLCPRRGDLTLVLLPYLQLDAYFRPNSLYSLLSIVETKISVATYFSPQWK